MEPITADVSLRPLRLGFLVSPRDQKMVRRVMRMATTMWGGQMSPIIPVMRQLPSGWRDEVQPATAQQVSRGYINFFEPDLLVQTAAGQLKTIGVEEGPTWSARERFLDLSELVSEEVGLAADLVAGINISHVYRHLYDNEFQFTKRHEPNIVYFSEERGDDCAFFEAAFGLFPHDKRIAYVRENFAEAFGAREVPPSFETWHDLTRQPTGYPLYYTIRDLEIRRSGRSNPAIFIFDPSSAADLIDFWNFRLFNSHVLPVNVNWLEASREVIISMIRRNHRPLPTNRNGVMIHTAIHVSRSLKLEEIVRRLGLAEAQIPQHSVSVQGWYESIWRQPDDDERIFRPGASIVYAKPKQVQLTSSGEGRVYIQFPLQVPDFDVGRMGAGPSFVNVIKVRQYGFRKQIAEALPAATFSTRDAYPVRAMEQFVSREGFITLHRYAHDSGHLHLPSQPEAISSWLKCRGVDASPSDAGRVAEQIIDAVGGLNGTALFRERLIIEQLDKMARSRREWIDGTVEEFSDKTAPIRAWKKILYPINKKLFGRWKTLDQLVLHGVLQLGLAPRCLHCTQENWYSLDDVATTVICSRCRREYAFPQGAPDSNLFKYRVVGPFATPGYAQGGYSVALTLQFLSSAFGSMNEFTYVTGLELTHAEQKLETDFFAWYGRGRYGEAGKDPITLVGECKSMGKDAFQAKDFARLKQLATLIPGAHLVVATLKDTLSPNELKGLRTLAKWGWSQVRPSPVLVLTGTELFGDGPLSRVWEDAGGARAATMKAHRHIFDFSTLAHATQQAALGLTWEQISEMRYGRSRALAARRMKQERDI